MIKRKMDREKVDSHFKTLKSVQEGVNMRIQSKKAYVPGNLQIEPSVLESPVLNYMNNAFIKDLSVKEQKEMGINIMYVQIDESTTSPLNTYSDKAQMICVRKGLVYDETADIRFEAGQTFFLSAVNEKVLHYAKGSEVLFIYVSPIIK